MLSGNSQVKGKVRSFLQNNESAFVALRGPHGVGKRFFLEELSEEYNSAIVLEHDIEKIQDFLSHSQYEMRDPTLVTIPNIDLYSFVHQDALLRILENPPSLHHIICTYVSDKKIQPSVLSRMDRVFTFSLWSDEEMAELAKSSSRKDLVSFCHGNPGLFGKMVHDEALQKIPSWIQNPVKFLSEPNKDPLAHIKTVDDKMYVLELMKTNFPALSANFLRRFEESANIVLDVHFQDVILQALRAETPV